MGTLVEVSNKSVVLNGGFIMKELKVRMTFYMEMKDGETEQEAIDRFYKEFTTENMTTESSMQVYDMEVQEV